MRVTQANKERKVCRKGSKRFSNAKLVYTRDNAVAGGHVVVIPIPVTRWRRQF